MPLALGRGLEPGRLVTVFVVLCMLFVFRSSYLPSTANFELNLQSPSEWWNSTRVADATGLNDVDVDVDHGATDVETLGGNPYTEQQTDHVGPTPSSSASSTSIRPTSSIPIGSAAPFQSGSLGARHCQHLPGRYNVVVIVKTGATEIFSRLPEQLVTLAECVPNLMVFSDMEQDLGSFHIHDALDDVGNEYKETHEDFKFYQDIRSAQARHGDLSALASERAWNLDKWKNIPMLHKAYTKHPDAHWYVTIDADTYLGWTNLLLLLNRLDPDEPLYAGCPYWLGDTTFAQGGTGYILSRNAVERFEAIRHPGKQSEWERHTSTICCGDAMLGIAMSDAGVTVRNAWPMFQVDPPSAFSWTDGVWCSPAITWHHVHSYEIEALWQFEKNWIANTWEAGRAAPQPYLYRDVFDAFVWPGLAASRPGWDNLSADRTITKPVEGVDGEREEQLWDSFTAVEQKSIESPQACLEACGDDPNCMQYTWTPGRCSLHHSIRMGRADKDDLVSGWMVQRVERFREGQQSCEAQFRID